MNTSAFASPPPAGSAEDQLCREILEVAVRERDARLAQTRQEAESLLGAAREEARQRREATLAEAREEAARQVQNLQATLPLEARRFRARHIEQQLESLRTDALARLARRTETQRVSDALSLALEAARQLAAPHLRLRFSQVDQPFLAGAKTNELRAHLAPRVATIEIVFGPEVPPGGVIAEDTQAPRRWDNTLAVRMLRLWPEIRRHLADSLGYLHVTPSKTPAP